MATNDQRNHLLAVMQWLIAKTSLINYAQVRPMATIKYLEQDLSTKFNANQSIAMDCSEAVTLVAKFGGLHDPNGSGYNGYGNSMTMYQNLSHYTNPSWAHVGAIVVFGPNGSEHAAMVMTPGSDPILFSHGSNAGPVSIPLSQEAAAHSSPVTFLDIGKL